MSKYEPITTAQTCGTCRYLSRDFVLTSYPAQAICTLYNETVFVNCKTCLDDLGRESEDVNERAETHACDLIDRQAAIDAADRADYRGLTVEDVKKVTDEVVKELKKLSSAQPEKLYTKADYIMALHKEYGCSLTRAEEAHNKALEYLQDEMKIKGGKNEQTIEERKAGKWITEIEDWRGQIVWVKCSECGFDASTEYRFCPNCGAKMNGGEERREE